MIARATQSAAQHEEVFGDSLEMLSSIPGVRSATRNGEQALKWPLPEALTKPEIWHAFSGSASQRALVLLQRYVTMYDRKYYRALHELMRIQAARRGQEVVPPLAVDVSINHSES